MHATSIIRFIVAFVPVPQYGRARKRPADLQLAGVHATRVVSRRADDLAGAGHSRDERAAALERIGEEPAEHRLGPAIVRGMARPDLRIARREIQRVPILVHQRAQNDTRIDESRLEIVGVMRGHYSSREPSMPRNLRR